jgi:hypothetical protein
MGLLSRHKAPVAAPSTQDDAWLVLDDEAPSSTILDLSSDEPLLTDEDYQEPSVEAIVHETPAGVDKVRVGVTVKISKSYNTYEAHFSAEGDPRLSSSEEIRKWVRIQCYDQLNTILTDLGAD